MNWRGLLLGAWVVTAVQAEVLDRTAVSIGTAVVTELDLKDHLRVRAFLEGVTPRYDGEALRDAADKLIQQQLIGREMESSRYALPDPSVVDQLVASFKQNRYGNNEEEYREALRAARLTELQIRGWFQWTLTILRFVEFRFRPGVQVPEEEIREYYETKYLPQWRQRSKDPPPGYAEVERDCEEMLTQERIDILLDRWISQTRTQVNIKFRDEVFPK